MNAISLLMVRLAVGMSMFGHGFVRLPKLTIFAEAMAKNFESTILPSYFTLTFGYILPCVELLVGVMLLLGLWVRFALLLGCGTMISLIFGSSLLEQWGYISIQLIHIAFFALLLNFRHNDIYCLKKD
ncbi:DoxX family membrane protein [Helicobacter saguini]|uniref:DoxX family membrane protein n=1 Tax=Helicobacter saguini TaxID=1548018 RepID=A0A347VNT6_9HELI|nr:DoxX family membrane protein [Helicobacter saguini]MWV61645.1 DoxX family membrane protein [Helicobacter saguini]MWV67683.1 DoxX family membrane protein [Helicobacter saguini]MWV70035.1 DoxX family membrane protein [Helicobacter saguini]MWV72752.1 DoxX family membrane protein [Helicobacter saguini]TLD92737.1 DoxX family membrane protein [Helicobacter saguini]